MTDPFDELAAILPSGLLRGEAPRLERARDCWPQALGWDKDQRRAHAPAAVALPAGEEDAAAVLAWCGRRGIPVVPRGAGSSVVGGAIPSRSGSLVLDTSRLTNRFRVVPDPDSPLVTAGAGWLGGELEARLNREGWSLLHFPASLDVSTVGGWIAHDGYGQLSTRFGSAGDQTLSLRAARLDGSVGEEYPARHLLAEGTLGVITEATLKIRPLPTRRRFAAFSFSSCESALRFAREAMAASPAPSVMRAYGPIDAILTGLRGRKRSRHSGGPSWFESVERFMLRRRRWLNALTPLAGSSWTLILVYEEEKGEAGAPPAPGEDAADLGPGPAARWWERRYHWSKDRLERVFANGCFADTVDLRGTWDNLARLEREVRAALKRSAFAFSHFSHFDMHGACLYLTFAGAGPAAAHARAWADAMEACLAAGESINHHHGFGLAKLPWIKRGSPASWLEKLGRERRTRDPHGLLNPGKLTEQSCR